MRSSPPKKSLTSSSLPKLRFLTLNCGLLPHHTEYNNSDKLGPNLQRVEALAKQIIDGNYDFVCLQEVWDTRCVARFKELLLAAYSFISAGVYDQILTYPNAFYFRYLAGKDKELYEGESLSEQLKIEVNRGGLLLISKLKILEKKSASYSNDAFGEETVAQKGYTGYKLQVGADSFISLSFTHMHANGKPILPSSLWWGGTFSHRRGQQHGVIYNDLIKSDWYEQPPKDCQEFHYLDNFFMGDVNTTVDSERQFLDVSGGRSATNGFDETEIKSDGMFARANEYEPVLPENFQEIREEFSSGRGVAKKVIPELVEKAQSEGKLTGTDILNDDQPLAIKCIDTLTIKKNPGNKMGEFKTYIVPFTDKVLADLSDHRGIAGEYDPNAPRIERKSKYEGYERVLTDKIDPSAGWPDRHLPNPPRVSKFVAPGTMDALKVPGVRLYSLLPVDDNNGTREASENEKANEKGTAPLLKRT